MYTESIEKHKQLSGERKKREKEKREKEKDER
jgi:hypothetical protein